jgi:hypothetical protein
MSIAPDDCKTLSEELEQSETAFYFAQWRYHLAEARRIELKMAQRRMRMDISVAARG